MKKSKKSQKQQGRNLLKQVPHRVVGGCNFPNYDTTLENESYLEKLAIKTFYLCHDVQKISTQKVTIVYIDSSGKQRKYTPDIKIDTCTGYIFLEVKPLVRLLAPEKRDDYLDHRKHVYRNTNNHLKFVTDDQLKIDSRIVNIKVILRYKPHWIDPSIKESLIELLDKQPISLFDLLSLGFRKPDVLSLIARRHLFINFNLDFEDNNNLVYTHRFNKGVSYEEILYSGQYGYILEKLVLEGGKEAQRCLAIAKHQNKAARNTNPFGFF